jgi:TFIIH basal transcription factor complex TTD-A subunit
MPTASKGVLVQCDPSIKALILQMDSQTPGIILEELDETHLLIKPEQVQYVKTELNNLLAKNIYNPFDDE